MSNILNPEKDEVFRLFVNFDHLYSVLLDPIQHHFLLRFYSHESKDVEPTTPWDEVQCESVLEIQLA